MSIEGRVCIDCDTMLAMDDWHDREDCIAALRADRDQAKRETREREDVLRRNGFVRCDVPACNCGSWHARYGLRERFDEIASELAETGVLNNATGNMPLNALRKLIEDRDRLAAAVETLRADAERWRHVEKLARQNTAYDVYGNGGHWSIGLFSKDGRLTFTQAVDAARAGEKSDD